MLALKGHKGEFDLDVQNTLKWHTSTEVLAHYK